MTVVVLGPEFQLKINFLLGCIFSFCFCIIIIDKHWLVVSVDELPAKCVIIHSSLPFSFGLILILLLNQRSKISVIPVFFGCRIISDNDEEDVKVRIIH